MIGGYEFNGNEIKKINEEQIIECCNVFIKENIENIVICGFIINFS